MTSVSTAVKAIGDDALKFVKDELKDLLTSVKKDADAIVKETGDKIADWLVFRAQGKLSDGEFEALLYSRDQLLRQYKNTLEIQA